MILSTDNEGVRGYQLDFRSDGVYLYVYPMSIWSKKISCSDVVYYLNSKQIKGYDIKIVEEAVLKRDGKWYKIAKPHENLPLDAVIKVNVSPDKMRAVINVFPPDGGKLPTYDDYMEALKKHNVVYGINTQLIKELCIKPVFYEDILVAEGTLPMNGKNGKIEYHFKITKDRTPKIMEDGRVDFRQLNLIENVHAGDVLATITPPVPGRNGMNVIGQQLLAVSGKPVIPPRGKNVNISDDGLVLTAAIDGQVVISDRKINVFQLYEVLGNVDSSTGNINFVGNVVVRGNVLTGFSIEAGGTVEVQGVVEGAYIKAGGDIVLRRGMQGANRGVLISDKSITAKYIENSSITAAENISCEAIMHSTVQCGGILELGGKKGLIVGGNAKVGKEIRAKVIGSVMETVTELDVGTDPIYKERYKFLKEEIEKTESEITKTEQAIQLLNRFKLANNLDQSKQNLLEKSISTRDYLAARLQELKNEVEYVEGKMEEEGYGKIKASVIIYPGTRVSIGTCKMYVKEPIKYATLYRDKADIRIGPYEK